MEFRCRTELFVHYVCFEFRVHAHVTEVKSICEQARQEVTR